MSDNDKKNKTDPAAGKADEKQKDPEKTAQKAEKKRFSLRRLKYGGIATAVTVVVAAVVVLINVILSLVAERVNMKIDITPDKAFEISQETIDYLNTISEPVEIVCMADELTYSTAEYIYYKQAYEVLKKYALNCSYVTLRFVDMVKDPTYADRYKSMYKGNITQNSIIVSSSKRIKVLSTNDLYNVEMDYQTFSESIRSSKAEQELTSAIMYVTDPDPLTAVMFKSETSGSSYDNVVDLMNSNGYNVLEIDPLTESIPEDADIVVINSPLNDYDKDLIDRLYSFLDNGGKLGKTLIYIADYTQNPTANIDAFLAEWGIKIGEGVIGDSDQNNTSSQSTFIIGNFIDTADNPYAEGLSDATLPFISYYSRPIQLMFDTNDHRSTKSLISTADTAYVFTRDMQEAVKNGENIKAEYASYSTMALGRKFTFDDNKQVYSNVLVVGSSEMLDEQLTSATYYNNGDYFVSTLNTLTGKTEGVSIVAKDLSSDTFQIDEAKASSIAFVFIVFIPLCTALIGVIVNLKRRHK